MLKAIPQYLAGLPRDVQCLIYQEKFTWLDIQQLLSNPIINPKIAHSCVKSIDSHISLFEDYAIPLEQILPFKKLETVEDPVWIPQLEEEPGVDFTQILGTLSITSLILKIRLETVNPDNLTAFIRTFFANSRRYQEGHLVIYAIDAPQLTRLGKRELDQLLEKYPSIADQNFMYRCRALCFDLDMANKKYTGFYASSDEVLGQVNKRLWFNNFFSFPILETDYFPNSLLYSEVMKTNDLLMTTRFLYQLRVLTIDMCSTTHKSREEQMQEWDHLMHNAIRASEVKGLSESTIRKYKYLAETYRRERQYLEPRTEWIHSFTLRSIPSPDSRYIFNIIKLNPHLEEVNLQSLPSNRSLTGSRLIETMIELADNIVLPGPIGSPINNYIRMKVFTQPSAAADIINTYPNLLEIYLVDDTDFGYNFNDLLRAINNYLTLATKLEKLTVITSSEERLRVMLRDVELGETRLHFNLV